MIKCKKRYELVLILGSFFKSIIGNKYNCQNAVNQNFVGRMIRFSIKIVQNSIGFGFIVFSMLFKISF